MPELPEVEAARRAIHDNCCGRIIKKASVADDPKVIEAVSAVALQQALIGRKILGAFRKGKNLWLQLDQRPWPSFQFGMTGAFHIKGMDVVKYKRSAVDDDEEWPSKFSKVFIELDNGLEVSFTDKRRFARVRLLDDPVAVPPISELGHDALLELPGESDFVASVVKKKCSIKSLLLDQSFLAGIGNWIADEVLYQARIHPEQAASQLSEQECKSLYKSIGEVIKLSVEVNADSGRFPVSWIFHYRWDKKPGKVDGKKIEFITVGGRTSAFVPELQKCSGPVLGKHTGNTSKKATQDYSEELASSNKETTKSTGFRTRKKPGKKIEKECNEAVELDVDGVALKEKRGQKKRRLAGVTEKVNDSTEFVEKSIDSRKDKTKDTTKSGNGESRTDGTSGRKRRKQPKGGKPENDNDNKEEHTDRRNERLSKIREEAEYEKHDFEKHDLDGGESAKENSDSKCHVSVGNSISNTSSGRSKKKTGKRGSSITVDNSEKQELQPPISKMESAEVLGTSAASVKEKSQKRKRVGKV